MRPVSTELGGEALVNVVNTTRKWFTPRMTQYSQFPSQTTQKYSVKNNGLKHPEFWALNGLFPVLFKILPNLNATTRSLRSKLPQKKCFPTTETRPEEWGQLLTLSRIVTFPRVIISVTEVSYSIYVIQIQQNPHFLYLLCSSFPSSILPSSSFLLHPSCLSCSRDSDMGCLLRVHLFETSSSVWSLRCSIKLEVLHL